MLLISLALWMSGLAQLMVEAKNIGSSRNSEGEMVWIVVERAPAPDMPYWSGRRWLAAIDAIAWPLGLGLVLGRVPGKAGLILPVASAVLLLWGLSRFHKAVWLNHRYRFTTWRVLGILAVLVIVAMVLKIAPR